MQTTLTDFILARFRELEAAEAPLRDQLQAIAVEREQLRRAAVAAGVALEASPGSADDDASPARRSVGQKTIKEAVLSVMDEAGVGMTAVAILEEINSRFGFGYPRSSISPQLSRLKSEGLVRLDGKIWYLAADAAEKVEPPRLAFVERGVGAPNRAPVNPGGEVAN